MTVVPGQLVTARMAGRYVDENYQFPGFYGVECENSGRGGVSEWESERERKIDTIASEIGGNSVSQTLDTAGSRSPYWQWRRCTSAREYSRGHGTFLSVAHRIQCNTWVPFIFLFNKFLKSFFLSLVEFFFFFFLVSLLWMNDLWKIWARSSE